MGIANTEQAEFWDRIAPTWRELEDRLEQVSALPGELAMDRAGLAPGQRALDLGCGLGRTTLELAARERAGRLGAANVEFVRADVQSHDLGTARFDAAYSRFGVMFFTDPVAAFGNVRVALAPGGTLSFVCWQTVFDNEWMLIPGAAVAEVTGSLPPMPGPGEPGPFSLSDPARARAVLEAAGFGSVDVTPHNDHVVTSEDRIPEVAAVSIRTGAGREALKDADEDTRRRAVAAIEAALRARVHDGQVRATRGVLLVTATA